MAFFPRSFYNTADTTASFTPLFRLLDDFDSYSRQGNGQHGCKRSSVPQWQPKFDVRETAEAYELHGELAGVNKDNVQIEFTEPQTMLVRGKVERSYTSGSSPSAPAETNTPPESVTGSESPKNSHQATVEDEFEAISNESTTEEAAAEKPSEPEEVQKKPVDNAKYWLTERNIGEFSRSFNFPSRVDQDTVSASFNDGILSIHVPKAKKHETRRISVL